MSLIGFLHLSSLILYIIILFLLLSRWKISFSYVIKRILLILIILSIFHSLSNTLERFYITDALDPYEDYVQILEPILWFFFFAIYIQEMTEKKRRESESKYRHLFETSPYFIGLMDTKGVIIDCNEAMNEILSIHTRGDIIGKNITEIFLLNENKYLIPIFEKGIKSIFEGAGTNQEPFDFQLYRPSGIYLWLHVEITLIEIEKQKLIQFIIQDITERKQAERELQLERDNFLNIFNSMKDGVYIVDKNYDLEYINPSLIKEFGQFEGIKCFKYFEDRNEICPQCKNKEVFQGKTVKGEWFSFKSQKTYDVIDTPLKNPDGSISKLGIFRDISEIRKAELIIQEEIEKLRELDHLKNEFVVRTSHELKTPLVSICGSTEFLLNYFNEDLSSNTIRHLEVINSGGKRLQQLVEDLLDIRRLDSNKFDLNVESKNLGNIIKNCINNLNYLAEVREITISTSLQHDVYLNVDEIKIEQVFFNLLSNALKNTLRKGKISISLEKKIDYANVKIKDTGVGFTEEEKTRIFEKFGKIERYGKGLDIISEGTGLGLFISKEIVELHGGKIWMESEGRNKGSTFIVSLPMDGN